MSVLAKQDNRRGASGVSAPGAVRRFKESYRLRLQSFKEAVADGTVPEGTIWLVRIIEAGQSLNGKTYTETALRAAAPVFEGVTVQNYAWSQDPTADDADHLPDAVAETEGRGLQGNQVGSLEGVHYNEEAKSLDGFLKVYDAKFREHLLTAFKLGDVGEGGERDTFGFSIDADGTEDENENVLSITAAHELTAVNNPAAGGRIRRLVASTGPVDAPKPEDADLTESAKATTSAPGEIGEQVKGEQEKHVKKSKLMESLGRRVALRENALEDKARMDMLMRAFSDEMDSLRWGEASKLPMAEQVAFAQNLTRDLAGALGGGGGEGMQESLKDAKLKENAATLAGELKLWADQLSTAADEDVPAMLEQIREAITKALDAVSEGTDDDTTEDEDTEAQEASVANSEASGAENATQDDFARMSAGMTEKLKEALKTGDPVKLREAAVEVVGEEPQLDEKDKEIASLKEKLKGQAIEKAMASLTESLAEGAGPTVLRLIDKNALTFNEDFSEVSGLKEAVKEVVKSFPGFGKSETAAAKGDDAAATAVDDARKTESTTPPAPEGERKTESAEAGAALTPQQAAQAVMAQEAAGVAALGQDVKLRESIKPGSLKPNAANMRQLKRFERQMLAGNSRAMKKHRDLRTQLGL